MKTAILAIDLQNDFTRPDGALAVNKADEDVWRIATFVRENSDAIDYIALTLDSHQPVHIANQIYWRNAEGEMPELFSTITAEDVRTERWLPQYNAKKALPYLERLELAGEVCTIWPRHCVSGTEGWAIDKVIMDSIVEWTLNTGRAYDLFFKGQAQSTEHYSIFKASVEWEDEPETALNTSLLDRLNRFDRVILVGEAGDICVANSLNDILINRPALAAKMVVLTDCTSWIYGDNARAKSIYERAGAMGTRFEVSENYRL